MSLLAVFDVSRNGEGPVERHKTGFKFRGKGGYDAMSNATGPRAPVSTLDVNCDSILALGTYTRNVVLYANNGRGDVVTSFSLRDVERDGDEVMGWGVSQVKWSPDGRYLFVAERRSEGISVYDIRGTGRRLGWLAGRDAQTNVKLGFDVVTTLDGCEVWAGTRDGHVKMWKDPTKRGGVATPDAEWKVHDGINKSVVLLTVTSGLILHIDPVCATLVHPSGSVIATVSAKDRNIVSAQDNSESSDDSTNEEDAISPSSESESSDSEDEEESGDDTKSLISVRDSPKKQVGKDSSTDSMVKIWSVT
jgi:WD40 repeat protein